VTIPNLQGTMKKLRELYTPNTAIPRIFRGSDIAQSFGSATPHDFKEAVLQHMIECRACRSRFDLFAAEWCHHADVPSKVCPACHECFCSLPSYHQPSMWKAAPLGFQKRGFQKIFVGYL
jgi:hypothetical protein